MPPSISWRDPWVWGVPCVCFTLAAILLLTQGNQTLFLYLNHLSGGAAFWSGATLFGDSLVAFTLLLPLVARRPDIIWAAMLAAILTMLWVHGLKPLIDLPRPTAVLPLDQIRVIGPEIHARSFPSGHTATAFALAGVLAMACRRRWARALLIAFACLVGLSRVAVSAHWPMDVLGGAFGGWLAACLGWVWSARWRWGRGLTGQAALAVLLLVAAVYLLLGYDARYHSADALKGLIAVLVLTAGVWRTTDLVRYLRRR